MLAMLTLLLFAATPAAAVTLTRGPYLQLLTPTSVTVVWNTDVAAACSLAISQVGGTQTIVSGATGTVCAIRLSGLTPGVSYAYRPRAAGVALRSESVFQTDDPDLPFAFLVVGDTGPGSNQLAVRDEMLASPAEFILHTGDMVYDDGAAEDFDPNFFTPYRDLVRRLVFWPVLGNHDYRTASGQPWRDAFYTPANNPARSENYYSFDYGNAHVVVLNSNSSTSPGGAQHTFLDTDLAASDARWKFVAFHHTIYSSSRHGSNTTIRNNLVSLFDKHRVDMVFMGHDHDYERTKSLRGNAVVAPGQGTVYVTTGGGGRSRYEAGESSFTAYSESSFHFTRVAVDGSSLMLQMIRADGAVRDTLTLTKSTSTSSVSATTRTSTTTTTTRASTTTLAPAFTRAPIADTYIEAGAESSWSHGGAPFVDIDTDPAGITYLKFDLRNLPRRFTRVRLRLYCKNPSPHAGTIHRVDSSTWPEGTANGLDASSVFAHGLKWMDVDTNGDRVIDTRDLSPFVPRTSVGTLGEVVVGQTYVVDVTPAFNRGLSLYTIAIRGAITNGATFASREDSTAARRPLLLID